MAKQWTNLSIFLFFYSVAKKLMVIYDYDVKLFTRTIFAQSCFIQTAVT